MRAVDVYTVRPWGLYMARPTPGRAQFHYLESWLLPGIRVRANVYHWNPGYEREQDFYLDVGEFTPGETTWRAEDHYVDLVVHSGAGTDLVDVDELLDAHHQGLVTTADTELAIRSAVAAIEGLARHDDDLHRWLSANGMHLSWAGLP